MGYAMIDPIKPTFTVYKPVDVPDGCVFAIVRGALLGGQHSEPLPTLSPTQCGLVTRDTLCQILQARGFTEMKLQRLTYMGSPDADAAAYRADAARHERTVAAERVAAMRVEGERAAPVRRQQVPVQAPQPAAGGQATPYQVPPTQGAAGCAAGRARTRQPPLPPQRGAGQTRPTYRGHGQAGGESEDEDDEEMDEEEDDEMEDDEMEDEESEEEDGAGNDGRPRKRARKRGRPRRPPKETDEELDALLLDESFALNKTLLTYLYEHAPDGMSIDQYKPEGVSGASKVYGAKQKAPSTEELTAKYPWNPKSKRSQMQVSVSEDTYGIACWLAEQNRNRLNSSDEETSGPANGALQALVANQMVPSDMVLLWLASFARRAMLAERTVQLLAATGVGKTSARLERFLEKLSSRRAWHPKPFSGLEPNGKAHNLRVNLALHLTGSFGQLACRLPRKSKVPSKNWTPKQTLHEKDALVAACLQASTRPHSGQSTRNRLCTRGVWPFVVLYPEMRADICKALKAAVEDSALLLASRLAMSGLAEAKLCALKPWLYGHPSAGTARKAKNLFINTLLEFARCGHVLRVSDADEDEEQEEVTPDREDPMLDVEPDADAGWTGDGVAAAAEGDVERELDELDSAMGPSTAKDTPDPKRSYGFQNILDALLLMVPLILFRFSLAIMPGDPILNFLVRLSIDCARIKGTALGNQNITPVILQFLGFGAELGDSSNWRQQQPATAATDAEDVPAAADTCSRWRRDAKLRADNGDDTVVDRLRYAEDAEQTGRWYKVRHQCGTSLNAAYAMCVRMMCGKDNKQGLAQSWLGYLPQMLKLPSQLVAISLLMESPMWVIGGSDGDERVTVKRWCPSSTELLHEELFEDVLSIKQKFDVYTALLERVMAVTEVYARFYCASGVDGGAFMAMTGTSPKEDAWCEAAQEDLQRFFGCAGTLKPPLPPSRH